MAKIDEEQGFEAESQEQNTMQAFERIGMFCLGFSVCCSSFCVLALYCNMSPTILDLL